VITNSTNGFFVASSSAYLIGNIAIGNPTSYGGGGSFAFISVSRAVNIGQGSFDERMIDNIAVI
jgi:hypothetical protein